MNKEKQGKKLRFNLKSNPIMGVLIPLIFIMLVTQIFNQLPDRCEPELDPQVDPVSGAGNAWREFSAADR